MVVERNVCSRTKVRDEIWTAKDGTSMKRNLIKWIVGLQVLEDSNFAEINDQLGQLERIEFIPTPQSPA